MAIPPNITVPDYPRFLPTPDQATMELFITCTNPLALIWVRQTIPAQLCIVEGPQEEALLRDCEEWYRNYAAERMADN